MESIDKCSMVSKFYIFFISQTIIQRIEYIKIQFAHIISTESTAI